MGKYKYAYMPPMHDERKELIQMGIWAGVAIIIIVAVVMYVLMKSY